MRRATTILAVALVLVAAMPALAHTGHGTTLVVHRQMFGAGWWADRFTTDDDRITITYGAVGTSEVLGQIVHLYDGAGNLLRGTTSFYLGGNVVDVVVSNGPTNASTDVLLDNGRINAAPTISFLCNATCNPSREFVLVVSGAGDNISAWGYGLFLPHATLLANTSGRDAEALSSRSFDGLVAHAGVAAVGEGVNVVQGATRRAHADDHLVSVFAKFSGTAPTRLVTETPVGPRNAACSPNVCASIVTKGIAGDYTFRYDDIDVRGDEAYLAWADVRFP